MALDLMLKNFLASSEFNNLENKNWAAVSKLVPGTTPRQVKTPSNIYRYLFKMYIATCYTYLQFVLHLQCQHRYEDLRKEVSIGINLSGSTISKDSQSGGTLGRTREDGESRGSRPSSAKNKGVVSFLNHLKSTTVTLNTVFTICVYCLDAGGENKITTEREECD